MQIIIVKFVDSFFRRVPTGARLKGDTLKLEVYPLKGLLRKKNGEARLLMNFILKPFHLSGNQSRHSSVG